MRRFLLYILFVVVFVSCKRDPVVDPDIIEKDITQVTLMYFTGTHLKGFYQNNNLPAIRSAIKKGALGERGRFLYLIPSSYSISTLYELSYDEGECVERQIKIYSDQNSLTSESVTNVIRDVKDEVDFDPNSMRMNMIYSGHATGWVMEDNYYQMKSTSASSPTSSFWAPAEGAYQTKYFGVAMDGFMNIEDLRLGIERSGVKMGYILFDACLMSNIEALYRLRDCSDYIISSPCEIMGDGFPYNYVLEHLSADNGAGFDLPSVCREYVDYYTNMASMRSGCVTMCVTSELEELADIVSKMSLEDVNRYDLQIYEGLSSHVFYDFGQYVNLAAATDPNLAEFNEQFDRTFPEECRLHTDYFYTAYTHRYVNIEYYSGVTTAEPSVMFKDSWVLEPWSIDSGRYIYAE